VPQNRFGFERLPSITGAAVSDDEAYERTSVLPSPISSYLPPVPVAPHSYDELVLAIPARILRWC
jgi:hypothetical protein